MESVYNNNNFNSEDVIKNSCASNGTCLNHISQQLIEVQGDISNKRRIKNRQKTQAKLH